MKCQWEDCPRLVEFSVKMGTVWGNYCSDHALDAVREEGQTSVKPFDPESEVS